MSAYFVRYGTMTWLVNDAASPEGAKAEVLRRSTPRQFSHRKDWGRLDIREEDLTAREATAGEVEDWGNPHLRWSTSSE